MKKLRTRMTRKNFIFISMFFFYLMVVFLSGFIADGDNSIIQSNSPLKGFVVSGLGLPTLDVQTSGYLILLFFVIYALICACAFIYEMRTAVFYEKRVFTKKYSLIYGSTFLVLSVLWIGLSFLAQIGQSLENIGINWGFFGQSVLIGTLLFVILGLPIFFLVMLIVNLKNIDKPFRFNKDAEEQPDLEADEEPADVLSKDPGYANSLAAALGAGTGVLGPIGGEGGIGGDDDAPSAETKLGSKEFVFPGLCSIDDKESGIARRKIEDNVLSLKDLVEDFRNYLAKEEGLYFSRDTLRAFIAGLASSRLIILEGLSGTGKSSLARYFSDFIGEESYFEAVQASWRDRTSLLGFYNDFSRKYDETDFLKRLYEMTFRSEDINIMVLDEVNISRVEYYFADFLSIMEYPIDKWRLRIMHVPYDFECPDHLQEGVLKIPENTWFIGTANKDDSTYTITDKVYDRAITISFDDRNEPFEVEGEVSKVNISYTGLNNLFSRALQVEENRLSKEDLEKFYKLTSFVQDTFDITFGNRVLNQIQILVPVYVECGGTKEDALDFIFARKVLYKIEGRFEDYVRQGLLDLEELINNTYSKEMFPLTRKAIERSLKRLG